MTADEVRDTYEFKVIKKALKRKFPFVKDVLVEEAHLNKFQHILPVNLVIDPFAIAQQYDVEIKPNYLRMIKNDDRFISALLDIMFTDRDKVKDIDMQMDKLSREVHNSPALPNEYKLPRPITMSLYYIDKDSIPKD
jgi:hypothetical protein